MATGNPNFATLATTTLQHFANEIFDNVITNNAALNQLKQAGNIKIVSGGRQFTHPVYYQKNTTFGAIGKFGTVPTDLQDPVTRAVYDIKVLAGSVVYSIVEEAMNAGNKEKLIDYVETLKMDAQTSMNELMGDQVMADQTAVGTDDMNSIPKIISLDPASEGTDIGGIDVTSNSFWTNYTHNSVGTFSSVGSDGGLGQMDAALNGTTYGRQGPTFIITNATEFGRYNAALTAQVRYTQSNTLEGGNMGFRNLMYATLPMMIDSNAPAKNMYFIDGKSLKLQVLAMGNMKMSPFQQAYSQLMARSILYILPNITCGSRRTQGVVVVGA